MTSTEHRWPGGELDRPFAHCYADLAPIQAQVRDVVGMPAGPSPFGFEIEDAAVASRRPRLLRASDRTAAVSGP